MRLKKCYPSFNDSFLLSLIITFLFYFLIRDKKNVQTGMIFIFIHFIKYDIHYITGTLSDA